MSAIAPAVKRDLSHIAAASIQVRRAQREWRHALAKGDVSLADLLHEQPVCMEHFTLLEALPLLRQFGPNRLWRINQAAVENAINLAVSIKDADVRVCDWLIDAVNAVVAQRSIEPIDGGWKKVADELDAAICRHHAMVADTDLPAEDFGNADEALYAAHATALKLAQSLSEPIVNSEGSRLPSQPIIDWLRARQAQLGVGTGELAARCGMDERRVRFLLEGERQTITLGDADRLLTNEGSARLDDLYPEEAVAA